MRRAQRSESKKHGRASALPGRCAQRPLTCVAELARARVLPRALFHRGAQDCTNGSAASPKSRPPRGGTRRLPPYGGPARPPRRPARKSNGPPLALLPAGRRPARRGAKPDGLRRLIR